MTTHFSYNDKELLVKIADGDAEAFRSFFIRYSPIMEKWVRQFVKNESETPGVLQDVFIQIWIYRDKLTTIDNLMPWLKTVTAHQCFKYLQREKKRRNNTETYQKTLEADTLSDSHIEQQVTYKDITSIIREVMATLTPQQLRIYQLSRSEGLSSAEIAQKMAISRGHVRNTIGIVLQKIRETLRKHDQLYLLAGISYFF